MPLDPPLYLDACATSPPADAVLAAMQAVHRQAWANPSSLHGFGLAAAVDGFGFGKLQFVINAQHL